MKRFFNAFYKNTGIIKDAGQRSVASRVSALTVEGTVLFSLLGTLGVDMSPLIAAAGVTGATLGFACKDFGANFVASIALSGQRSLRSGNKVTIGTGTAAVSGVIVDWDTRYLYLRNEANNVVCVPNNLILNSVVFWHNANSEDAASPSGNSTTSPFKGTEANISSLGKDKEWTVGAGAAESFAKPKDK